MPPSHPLISCLLITADRLQLCRRAINCYEQQTYPNTELVVVDNGKERMEHLVQHLPDDEVVYIYEKPTPDANVDVYRNIGLEQASGEFIAPQWDDDDWSHPERLRRQADVLMDGYDACTFAGTLMHVDADPYFERPFLGLLPNGVPPTILHRRDPQVRFPGEYRIGDTTYLNEWRDRRYALLSASETAHLYLRYFHGDNLWEQDHFIRRARNTPKDLMLYVWHKYVHGDEFGHPRYQISPAMREAFKRYLDDSRRVGVFEKERVEVARAR